jgi:protease-4
MSHGIFAGPAALEAGLVDHMGYADQVRESLREHAGTDEYQKLKFDDYLKQVKDTAPEGAPTIAVVFGEGPISASSGGANPFETSANIYGPKVAKAIREAAEDEEVDAIVFRVNSPGGSAVGSDFIWREIERAQEAGKPVVVSMSNVAGSGGYWVAMGADAIVAHPSTITGSIGVVFGKFNVRGLYEWLGASVDSVTLSENADLMSPFHSMDEDQLRAVHGTVQVMYDDFVRKVAEGRGMDFAAVEPLAHGRIWSGQDALGHGLVDALGGLDVAIDLAREEAGIDGEARVAVYPAKKEWIELLLEGELSIESPELDHAAALEALIEELETPKVRAVMPEFRVR